MWHGQNLTLETVYCQDLTHSVPCVISWHANSGTCQFWHARFWHQLVFTMFLNSLCQFWHTNRFWHCFLTESPTVYCSSSCWVDGMSRWQEGYTPPPNRWPSPGQPFPPAHFDPEVVTYLEVDDVKARIHKKSQRASRAGFRDNL